ncbi:MAG: hypothetical protein U0133_10895 [Gemmatimonadales bacterium]
MDASTADAEARSAEKAPMVGGTLHPRRSKPAEAGGVEPAAPRMALRIASAVRPLAAAGSNSLRGR